MGVLSRLSLGACLAGAAAAASCGPVTVTLRTSPDGPSLQEQLARRAGEHGKVAHVAIELSEGVHRIAEPLHMGKEHSCTSILGAGMGVSVVEGKDLDSPVLSIEDADSVRLSGWSLTRSGQSKSCVAPSVCAIDPVVTCPPSLRVSGGHSHDVSELQLDHGLQGFGGHDHSYSHLRVQNTAGVCVAWFDAGDPRNLVKSNLMFTDLTVGPCQNEGVGFQNVTGATLQHSEVRDAGCAGVRIDADHSAKGASPLNVVQYNKFVDWGHGTAKYSGDMAAIYFYGHWYCPGTTVLFNYAEQNHVEKGGVKCLYFDDSHSDVNATGNICYGMSQGIEVNGGWEVSVKDTLLVNVHSPGSINCKGIVSNYDCSNVAGWVRHLDANNYTSPPWSNTFPWYKDLCSAKEIDGKKCDRGAKTSCSMLPIHNTVTNIVGVRNTSEYEFGTGYGCEPFPTAVTEFNKIGKQRNFGQLDVGFADEAKKNWLLKADSIIYKEFPDFTRIPFNEIGVRPKGSAHIKTSVQYV